MGSRGPAPKRSDQRRRANEPAQPITRAPGAAKVTVPRADPKWHPVAKAWYQSLRKSGQSHWYEPSDWAAAVVLAETMSRELSPRVVGTTDDGDAVWASVPVTGASLSAILRGMTSLGVTEADRRRMGVELDRPAPAEPDESKGSDVSDLAVARRRRSAR